MKGFKLIFTTFVLSLFIAIALLCFASWVLNGSAADNFWLRLILFVFGAGAVLMGFFVIGHEVGFRKGMIRLKEYLNKEKKF